MSDGPSDTHSWHFFVEDMLEFGEKVLSYTDGLDEASFIADGLTYDATMRNIHPVSNR